MKLTKSKLKQLIKEELRKVLNEDMSDPSCLKLLKKLKSDKHYPLRGATFWNAKGQAIRIFQRDDDLNPAWYDSGAGPTTASDEELLAAALNCLKNKCARGSKVAIKGDPNIKMMAAYALTEEEIKAAFIMCN